jgi:hypothetical protein
VNRFSDSNNMSIKNSGKKKEQSIRYFATIRFGDGIVPLFFIFSSIPVIWAIQLYRQTIIQPGYFVLPMLLSGTFFSIILLMFKTSTSKFWTILQGLIGGASLMYFVILYVNYEYRDHEKTTDEFPIVNTGSLAPRGRNNCGAPYAEIDFWGVRKQLFFTCKDGKSLRKFQKVKLTYSKGKFGFDVILEQKLEL